jgi:hypothetical protein
MTTDLKVWHGMVTMVCMQAEEISHHDWSLPGLDNAYLIWGSHIVKPNKQP